VSRGEDVLRARWTQPAVTPGLRDTELVHMGPSDGNQAPDSIEFY
jgi:hypothetical protein